jgi:hypothetical protein
MAAETRVHGLAVRSAVCGALVLAACGSSAAVGPASVPEAIVTTRPSSTMAPLPSSSSTAPPPSMSTTSASAPGTTHRSTAPTTSSSDAFTPLAPPLPSVGGSHPLKISWSRSTVPAGPYNGRVRSDGSGLTSIKRSTPNVVWVSDDGTAWHKQLMPAGFEATDASRSSDLIAAVGTVTRDGVPVPAIAVSHNDDAWVLTVLDLDGRGTANNPTPAQVAVSGNRIVAAVTVGPEPGGVADTPLVFIGDSGPPFSRQVNTRFKNGKPSVGSQYIWWTSGELADGVAPVSTIFGPADPTGIVDFTSLEAGWQLRAHLAGVVTHIGGRDAGQEYFAIDQGGSPGSVSAIISGTSLVLNDEIAARVFNGMTWLRTCCLNAEPSIGVGQAGLIALATTGAIGVLPTPDLSKLAIAISPNGIDWTTEPIGQLLPEHGLDVTQLFSLRTRFLVVVTDRYPEPNGTREAIVLVGEIT